MALKSDSRIPLNDGHKIPKVGFGTFSKAKYTQEQADNSVMKAIDTGYRLVADGCGYCEQVEVGSALSQKIADGTVKREDLFYMGMVPFADQKLETVRAAIKKSLTDNELNYMDLFLIYASSDSPPRDVRIARDEINKLNFHNIDILQAWKTLETWKDGGLARSIGVSNFNQEQLELILNTPGMKYKPVINEVECHLYRNQSKLQEFCQSHDILLAAYGVLGTSIAEGSVDQGTPKMLENPVLKKIATEVGRTEAQVAMRFLLQRNIVVLTKSSDPEEIEEDLKLFDFELSDEQMEQLNGLNQA